VLPLRNLHVSSGMSGPSGEQGLSVSAPLCFEHMSHAVSLGLRVTNMACQLTPLLPRHAAADVAPRHCSLLLTLQPAFASCYAAVPFGF